MLYDWLQSLRQSRQFQPRRSSRHRSVSTFTHVRTLEPRRLLSAVPVTPEFGVNTFTTGTQSLAAIASDDAGNYVIAWQSNGQDGNGFGIYAQRFNAAGDKVGSEFRVNTFTTGDQTDVAVAMDADGDFLVTWTSANQDGSGSGIYAQRYNNTGVVVGSEFRVNTTTTGNQASSSVGMDANGDFVVAWQDGAYAVNGTDGDDAGIYAQRYNNAGATVGSQFLVNTTTTGNQALPDVAMNASGAFVIIWSSGNFNATSGGKLYDAAGNAVGGEFDFTTAAVSNVVASVAMDDQGDFAVAWHSGTQPQGVELRASIYVQRFNASGVKQGVETVANDNSFSFDRLNPDIAMDATGNFVIAWHDFSSDNYGFDSVYAQCFDAAGNKQGVNFKVNAFPAFQGGSGQQKFAAVTMVDADHFTIAWSGDTDDDRSNGIAAIQYGDEQRVQTAFLPENRPFGTTVTTVESTNPNPVTYAITSGNTSSAFSINSSTGQITVNNAAVINFEVNTEWELTVTATEVGNPGNVETVTVAILIFDVNEAPTMANQTFGVLDTAIVGSGFGKVAVTDPDQNPSYLFSITAGNTGNAIGIIPETGHLFVNNPLDADTTPQYQLTVRLQDGAFIRTATITVNVIDGGNNQAPVFQPPTTFSIAENRSVGTVVGDVNATDPDGDMLTYSIVGGDPNAQFAINPTTGVITVAKATINFEATPQFLLSVRATDDGSPSLFTTQTVTVNITDLNEAPSFLAPTTFTISENRPVGYVVGDVNTVDPEGNNVTFSIVGGDPNAQFAINATTGVITVAKATINFEATPQYLLSVKAQDDGAPANSRTQTITVNVANLNEAPSFLPPTTFSVPENSVNNTLVGTVQTADPEGQTVTYAITAGNTNNAFSINASNGQIRVANQSALDFETTPQFLLSVRATDNGSPANSRTQTITINLTNVADSTAPALSLAADFSTLQSLATESATVDEIVVDGGEFRVNTVTTNKQLYSSVATDADGDYIVTWSSYGQDGHRYGVYAQRYNAVGVAQGAEFRVNTYTTGQQRNSVVAMDALGNFVIAWSSDRDGSSDGIYAQRYNAAGVAQGAEFKVNTFTTNSQRLPQIAMDVTGDFVVAWQSYQQDGSGDGIYAQRYNATGVAQGSEFRVNTSTTGQQRGTTVAMNDAGDFVVAWESFGSGNDGLFGQGYDAAGVAQGTERFVAGLAIENDAVANTFTANSAAANSDLIFTDARATPLAGTDASLGGSISVTFVNSGANQALSVSVATDMTGNKIITVNLATNGGSAILSTAEQVQTAIEQHMEASALVTVEHAGASTGAGVVDVIGTTALTGGTDYAKLTLGDRRPEGSPGTIDLVLTAGGAESVVVAQNGDGSSIYVTFVAGATTLEDIRNLIEASAAADALVSVDLSGDGNSEALALASTDLTLATGTLILEPEFLIGAALAPGVMPAASAAMDADGDFVIAWAADDIYARRYNSSGVAQGSKFKVNIVTVRNETLPAVAMDADGDFIVTWSSYGQDGSGQGIFARQFDAAGMTVGSEFRVNTYTTGHQHDSSVAMDAAGDFVVSWSSLNQDGSNYGVYAQRYEVNQPPVINDQTFAVAENRILGDTVGQVFVTDPNGGPLTFAIASGNTGDAFFIDAQTGVITIAGPLTAGDVFNLMVFVTDNGNPPANDSATITINVLDATNHPPVFQPPTEFTIAENRPVGFVVGTVHADDPNGNTISYSIIGGDPNAQFAINASTGQITVAQATINFETTPQFTLQVLALDNGSPAESATQNITVNVTDLNEAPVFLAPTTFTMSENRPVGYVVGDVNTLDPEGNPVTYAIVGGDGKGQFQIDPFTGVITVKKATIDFEANPFYLLQVKASDNGVPANSRTQTITVNVTNLNEAPVFVGPATFNYAENQPVGSFVGDVNAVDPENNALTYGIVGGNPNGTFAIDTTTGVITLAKGSINFEATSQFVLQVRVQDNGNPSQNKTRAYTINVTNVNEAPIFVPPTTFSLLENRPVGHVVGTVSAVDPENGPLSYTIIGGNTNAQFAINPNTGQITVAKATIDFETTPQHVLQIKAVDSGNPTLSATQNITINVTNVNEAPNFLIPTTFTVAENTGNGVVVGTVKTADPEGNAITYSIVGGNTGNAFTINPTAGEIIVANSAALDFETTPQFLLSVKATDNGSPVNSRTQTITINLANVVGAGAQSGRSQTSVASSVQGLSGEQTATTSPTVVAPPPKMEDAGFELSDDDYALWLADEPNAEVDDVLAESAV